MKKRNYIFMAVSMGIALIALFLAIEITPWFYAINTRVRLYLDAPADTRINLCWDEAKSECLPLVPYSEVDNNIAQSDQIAGIWLTELPPRPVYHLSLTFNSDIHHAKFYKLELDSSKIFTIYEDRAKLGINNLQISAQEFKALDASIQSLNGTFFVESDVNGQIILDKDILPDSLDQSNNVKTIIMIWSLLFSIYLLLAVPTFLFPHAILNLGSAIKTPAPQKYSWGIYSLCAVIAVLMVLLVVNSEVIFNQFDPLGYLNLATGGGWFDDARLPGYPLFLGLTFKLVGYSLNGVVLFQAIFLSISVLFCIWVLRRSLHPIAAILFSVLCLFSPAQVHWSRWILRESLFASLVLIGITVAIAHFTARKPLPGIWLLVFAVLCGMAFLVRENGILLPVALFPVLLPELIKRLKSPVTILERVRSVFTLAFQYISPVIAIGLVYLIFSSYNYFNYGYFQVLSQQTHSPAKKTLFTGNFDSRSLFAPQLLGNENKESLSHERWPLYSLFILARDQNQNPGVDPIYSEFFSVINKLMSEQGISYNSFRISSTLYEIGKSSESWVPWQANLVGVLRQYRYVFVPLSVRGIYSQLSDDPAAFTNKEKMLNDLPTHAKINFERKFIEPNSLIANYYNNAQNYKWVRLLVVLALLSSLYILRFEDPLFLAPMALFLANVFLLLFTRMVIYRYIVSLDVLLILQAAFGLSFLLRRRSFIAAKKPI